MIEFLDTYWPLIYVASGFLSMSINAMRTPDDEDGEMVVWPPLIFIFGVFWLPCQIVGIVFQTAVHIGKTARKDLGEDHYLRK